jgi:hypothetical protein
MSCPQFTSRQLEGLSGQPQGLFKVALRGELHRLAVELGNPSDRLDVVGAGGRWGRHVPFRLLPDAEGVVEEIATDAPHAQPRRVALADEGAPAGWIGEGVVIVGQGCQALKFLPGSGVAGNLSAHQRS